MIKQTAGNCCYPGEYLSEASAISSPLPGFQELVAGHSLPDMRKLLREVFQSAFCDQHCNGQSYFFLFTRLEKMIEAVYLLAENGKSICAATEEVLTMDETIGERFYKPPRLEEIASIRPAEALAAVFIGCTADELIQQLHRWKHLAITTDQPLYSESTQREQLLIFCDLLAKLVRAANLYCCYRRSAEMKEMENFYSTLTFTFAQRELWDCFEAVSSDSRDHGIERKAIITTYRRLLAVIIAAYHLLENAEAERSGSGSGA